MPNCSVIQGSKLSSLFYSLFTVDTLKVDKMMKDKEINNRITEKQLSNNNIINHKI